MRAVVNQHQVGRQEEDGDDVTEDNLAVEVVKLGHQDIHQECDDQEDAADDTTDGVDQSESEDVAVNATVLLYDELVADVPHDLGPLRDTLHHHLCRVAGLVPSVVHTVVAGHSVVGVVEAVVVEDSVGIVGLHGHH